ncbi:MAG: amidohydrolase [Clostridiales bacterium]|nr:amidohydrolase [Clostridiales bacterium]
MLDFEQLKNRAESGAEETIALYRHLHQYPEAAHREQKTNQFLRECLNEWGIPYLAPADNITIALVDSGKPGATVGIRCDTDALPVTEETNLPYASQNPGVMHACGHDGHMAMGLAAARMLAEMKDQWQGKAKIIFQPAEEGEDGASEVIATGLVNDVDVFFGVHLWSAYETGWLYASPTVTSAAVDMFEIRIHGQGGHGATPEKCRDAIVAASELVMSLQAVVSRRVSPLDAALITIGSFHGGTAGNIIAQDVTLKGTFRTLNASTRKLVERCIGEAVEKIAAIHGCRGEFFNTPLHTAVENDPAAVGIARRCALALCGAVRDQKTAMLGDDFSAYGQIAPYCYMQIGIADEKKGTNYAHHNSHFAIDPDMLPLGAAWLAAAAAMAGEEWQRKDKNQ